MITRAGAGLLDRLLDLLQLPIAPDLLLVQLMALALVLIQQLVYVLALHALAYWIFPGCRLLCPSRRRCCMDWSPSILSDRLAAGQRLTGTPVPAAATPFLRAWCDPAQPLPDLLLLLAGTRTAETKGSPPPAAPQRPVAPRLSPMRNCC